MHLSLRPATPELPEQVALTWRSLRERAATDGAPRSVLGAVDEVVSAGPHRLGAGLSIVGSDGQLHHTEHLRVPPDTDLVRWEPVPALIPLIAARQTTVPHIVALVDRVGADLLMRDARASGADADVEVEGMISPSPRWRPEAGRSAASSSGPRKPGAATWQSSPAS